MEASMAGMAQEFKAFVMRGNVVDLAVGVVIGAAFGKIVSSFVGDVLMPPIGLLLGVVDFTQIGWVLKPAAGDKPAVVLGIGKFIQSIVDFLIVAFAIFLVVKAVNRMRREEPPPPPPAPSTTDRLLGEIRDLLRTGR
jgi:large conductance mechanosensitive channel